MIDDKFPEGICDVSGVEIKVDNQTRDRDNTRSWNETFINSFSKDKDVASMLQTVDFLENAIRTIDVQLGGMKRQLVKMIGTK